MTPAPLIQVLPVAVIWLLPLVALVFCLWKLQRRG